MDADTPGERRRFTASLTAKLARALRGDKTVLEIASKHRVRPNQIVLSGGGSKFPARGAGAFSSPRFWRDRVLTEKCLSSTAARSLSARPSLARPSDSKETREPSRLIR